VLIFLTAGLFAMIAYQALRGWPAGANLSEQMERRL